MNLPKERLRWLGRRLPSPVKRVAKRVLIRSKRTRPPLLLGRARWGNLRRTRPFSAVYGMDRGDPIDRRYIADFLRRHAADIRGEVLEMGDDGYSRAFGGDRVTATHILDIDPQNHKATIIADLGEPDSLPEGRFRCFLLTQTLQYVPDVEIALRNAWRALAPDGTLVISVPTVARVDPGAPTIDRWRFTPAGLEQVLGRSCPDGEIEVKGYGNVLAATAFLMGLASEELRESEIMVADPGFPVLACARVKKAPG